jgi:hypothetical protein
MLGTDIEISEDMYIIQKSVAEQYRDTQTVPVVGPQPGIELPTATTPSGQPSSQPGDLFGGKKGEEKTFSLLRWVGEVTPQKWMNFYTKVLSRFVTGGGLKLKVEIEVKSEDGVSQQKVEQTKVALRELGLNEDISAEK